MRNKLTAFLLGALWCLSAQAGPHMGDFPLSANVRCMWNTFNASGASVTRATNGTVAWYEDGNTTQVTTGVTDTEDFDAQTGVHEILIAATGANGFEAGKEYHVALSGATIDGQTVNAQLCSFSIERGVNVRSWNSVALGTTNPLPNVAAGATGGLPVEDANGNVPADVARWLGTAAATPTVNGVPEVDITHSRGLPMATCADTGFPEFGVVYGMSCAVTSYTHATGVVVLGGSASFADNQLQNKVIMLCSTTEGCQAALIESNLETGDALTLYAPLTVDIQGDTITATIYGTPQASPSSTPPTVAEIVDGVWDRDATSNQDQGSFGQAIGDPAADTNTIYKAVVTDATGATVGVDAAAILDDTGTSGVQIPAGEIDAAAIGTGAIDADAIAAAAIGDSELNVTGSEFTAIPQTSVLDYIEQFACDSGDADTCVDAGLAEADGFWRGVALRSLSGTTAGQERCVIASDQSSTDVTVAPPFPASLGTGTVQLVADPICAGVDPTYTP